MATHRYEPVPVARLAENLRRVSERLDAAAKRSGREPGSVRLVAVTKYVGVDEIRALLKLGVKELGENRIQLARPKIAELAEDVAAAGARWRMIGHLQTNKAKPALQDFAAIDAVDSIRLLESLAKEAGKRGRAQVPCLAEVNISGEKQKHGLRPDELRPFLERASALPQIDIQGLMTMAPFSDEPEVTSRPVFEGLRKLAEDTNARSVYPRPLRELSMGMTQDYEMAIEEGATLVRVGSALYEERGASSE